MNHLTENELLELAAGHRIVRRQTQHLAQCSDCTKRLAQTRALITLAQQESPTPMTDTKLQQRLWSTLPPAPRKHQTLPLRPLGLVGSVALAAGAALFFAMPGSVVRPTVSFASVEEAMSKIQTVHWTETSELRTPWSFDSNGAHLSKTEKVNVITRDCWSDLEKSQMTQISITRKPNYLREERTLYDSKYMIRLRVHTPELAPHPVRMLYNAS